MTTATVVCAVLAVVVVALVLERRRPNPEVAALLKTIDRVLVTVDDLCDRIQAPQMAALRHQEIEPDANPPGVSIFDDDEYWESREQMAERLSTAERNGDE